MFAVLTSASPEMVSVKQCPRSWCAVTITQLWPRSCSARLASTMRRSAPPIPRSGWMKTTFTMAGSGRTLC